MITSCLGMPGTQTGTMEHLLMHGNISIHICQRPIHSAFFRDFARSMQSRRNHGSQSRRQTIRGTLTRAFQPLRIGEAKDRRQTPRGRRTTTIGALPQLPETTPTDAWSDAHRPRESLPAARARPPAMLEVRRGMHMKTTRRREASSCASTATIARVSMYTRPSQRAHSMRRQGRGGLTWRLEADVEGDAPPSAVVEGSSAAPTTPPPRWPTSPQTSRSRLGVPARSWASTQRAS